MKFLMTFIGVYIQRGGPRSSGDVAIPTRTAAGTAAAGRLAPPALACHATQGWRLTREVQAKGIRLHTQQEGDSNCQAE